MSVTLKEMVDLQPFSGASDTDIIKQWFILNEQESVGISMITSLSEAKISKLQRTICNAQMWIPTVPDIYESNNGKVPKDVAKKLNVFVQRYLLDMGLNEGLLKWAKETIPNMKIPTCIFVPMVEWLESEYGIYFKDRK